MGKITMIAVLIVLGLFAVLVINNNAAKVKPVTQGSALSLPSVSPVISQTQTLNTAPSKTSAPSSQAETATAIIKTKKGDIELTLYPKEAPNTVQNFVQKAKSGFYIGKLFHRVEDWVIQGGDPLGNGTGGRNMPTELNNQPFVVGSLGVARGGDIKVSNDAQFFITKKDSQFLNGQYTNFGIVTKGMDVVQKIAIEDKILEIEIN